MSIIVLNNMPTMKQKQAIKKVVENGGIVSKAMIDVGYSPNTAKTPSKLTDSKYFRQALAKLDDSKYLDRLDDFAMDATDKRAALQSITEIFKLKNRYPKESIDIDLSLSRKEIIEPD
jgi:hypothetical protein